MGSLLLSADAMAGGTPEPPFGPAPAPLAGPELPSFRFPLGSQPTKSFNGGTAKKATVAEFPVSEKLAGVYMTLEPGGLRELHWHANAAEWAYVIEGRCRVTTIDPKNQCEIVDFGPGDVWYFRRGHGHSIQGLGPGTCTFVLVFDNGYFSEFGTFSITDWLGHTPPEVLAKTFNVPAFCVGPQSGLVEIEQRIGDHAQALLALILGGVDGLNALGHLDVARLLPWARRHLDLACWISNWPDSPARAASDVAIKIDATRSLRIGGALGPVGPRTRILRLG